VNPGREYTELSFALQDLLVYVNWAWYHIEKLCLADGGVVYGERRGIASQHVFQARYTSLSPIIVSYMYHI
jgi:hypothetical protein